MDPHATDTDTVRHIRTFADDVRRAHGEAFSGDEAEVQRLTPIPKKSDRTEATKKSVKKEESHKPQPQLSEVAPKQSPTSLQRAFNTMQGAEPQTNENDDIGTASGTIVRDNIRKRWSLSGSLKKAFTSWFKEKRAAFEEAMGRGEEVRPDVAPAATRADIIKKAGTYGTIAPQDDYNAVLSGLRTQGERSGTDREASTKKSEVTEAHTKTYDTHDAAEESKVGWTHTIQKETQPESRTPTPRSIKRARPRVDSQEQSGTKGSRVHREHITPDGTNVIAPVQKERADDEAYIKRQKEVKEGYAKDAGLQDTADVAPNVEREEEGSVERTQTRAAHSEAQRAQEQETVASEEGDRYREDPTKEEEISPIPLKETSSKDSSHRTSMVRTFRDDAIHNVEQKRLSRSKIAAAEAAHRDRTRQSDAQKPSSGGLPVVLMASLIAAILIGGGTAYLWMQNNMNTESVVVTRVPSFIGNIEQIAIGFSDDRAELMEILTDAVRSLDGDPNTVTQLYPSRSNDAGEQVIDTGTFMGVFDPQTNGSFVRSLRSEMMFGVYTGERAHPFFVFRTEQFDTALAGMLAWEGAMSADLTPLFGPPVRRTFDPTALTADSAREAAFTDEVIRNTNVRVLYDELGEVRISYAFVDKETLVITTSIESMVALLEQLR